MLACVLSGGLALHAPGLAGRQSLAAGESAAGCTSLVDNIPDLWCDSVCATAPDTESCKPVCKCPAVAKKTKQQQQQQGQQQQGQQGQQGKKQQQAAAASPAPVPGAQQAGVATNKCKSKVIMVGADWCDGTCLADPTTQTCVDSCDCPGSPTGTKKQEVPDVPVVPAVPDVPAVPVVPVPPADAEVDPKKQCKAIAENLPDEWCQSVCAGQPSAGDCTQLCNCPCDAACKASEKMKKEGEPAPPNPRILGGWTDCGSTSGLPSKLSDRTLQRLSKSDWGNNKAPPANCTREEEQALQFKDVLEERGRDPSYSHDWGATAILPGRFGGPEIAPIYGTGDDYKYYWLTYGGEDTDSRSWMDTAEDDIQRAGATGAAFDIEGGVTPADMNKWIKSMRKKHPHWTYVYIPQAHDDMVKYDAKNGPDFVAPMLYYSNYNSYPDLDVSKTGNQKNEAMYALLKLKQGGWPASRTILTYQSFDAARVFAAEGKKHTLLPFLGKLLGNFSVQTRVYGETFTVQGPYAGVLGWPAQCAEGDRRCWPDADKANMNEVMKGAKESGVHFKVPNGQGHF